MIMFVIDEGFEVCKAEADGVIKLKSQIMERWCLQRNVTEDKGVGPWLLALFIFVVCGSGESSSAATDQSMESISDLFHPLPDHSINTLDNIITFISALIS